MFSGQHDIDQDPQSIDIGGRVRLGQAVLFRRGESGGAENLGIGFMTGLVKTGGVKIDQDRIGTAKHNVFRFYIRCTAPMEWNTQSARQSCFTIVFVSSGVNRASCRRIPILSPWIYSSSTRVLSPSEATSRVLGRFGHS